MTQVVSERASRCDGHAWSCEEGAHLEPEDRGCHDEPPEQFNTKLITLATSGRPPWARTHNQRGMINQMNGTAVCDI